ncbi:helix-turn-helix domain-containing protein [Frankia tisae]|uniref:helix-turn-helix domain-containing protein n=1 Tax=Frankia tisae TaxID=2950104 RepID=UPI0034D58EF7
MRGRELTLAEREEISRGLAAELSHRVIAVRLERSQSIVSREVNRNGGNSGYRAAEAQKRADAQRRRPKISSLSRRGGCMSWSLPGLRTTILRSRWSAACGRSFRTIRR